MSSGRITRANQQSIQRGQQRGGDSRNGAGVEADNEGLGRSTRSTKEVVRDVSKEKEMGRVTRARTVLSTSVVNGVGLRARRRSTVPEKEENLIVVESPSQKRRILEVVIPTSPTLHMNATASSSSPTSKGMSLRRGRTGSVSTASVASSTAGQVPVKTRTSTRMRQQKEQSMSLSIEKPRADREGTKDKQVMGKVEASVRSEKGRRSRSATSSGLSSPVEEMFAKPEMDSGLKIEKDAQSDVTLLCGTAAQARLSPKPVLPSRTGLNGDQAKPTDASSPPTADPSCSPNLTTTDTSAGQAPSTSNPSYPLPPTTPNAPSRRSTAERPRTAAAERPQRRSVKCSPSPAKPAEGTPAVHSLRSTKGQARKACDVPFPPLDLVDPEYGGLAVSAEEKENGSLGADDLKDEKLLAVCAALDLFGNRALTATEIGDACVNQGWMRPSPALPSANLVQSVIRAYQRRCAAHRPERICLIRKHILAGYAMESRLIPALHPSAAQDGFRRKGMVFYLEGQVGHRVWTNPFDTLQDGNTTADAMQIDKPASEARSRKNNGIVKGKPSKERLQPCATSSQADDIDMEAERPPFQDKPSGLKIKIKLGAVYNGVPESRSYVPPEDEFAMTVERNTSDESSTDESWSEESSDEDSVLEGREDSYAFPEYGDEASDDSDELDEADDLPRTTSIKDLARSFFMDSPPQAIVTEPLPNHVRFSPLVSSASLEIPANPLDSGIFDETDYMPALSPPDEQAGSSSEDEDEAATEFMDTLDYGRLKRSNTSTKRVNFHPMAYRDAFSPVDLDGSEIDTPATTPRTYCDDDEETDMQKYDPADQVMDSHKADIDDDLQKAVQVLGQLLPDFSDPLDLVRDPELSDPDGNNLVASMTAISYQQDVADIPLQGTSSSTTVVARRRKSSIGARDFLRLSLPFPLCPAPSPLQSPAALDQPGLEGESAQCQSLDQSDNAIALRSLDFEKEGHSALDMELLPDLDRQTALTDCELACICNPELSTMASMQVDMSSHPVESTRGADNSDTNTDPSENLEADLREVMQNPQSWADLLGPESVGLEELDNVWGFMNAAVAAVAAGQTTRHRRGEADSRSIASTRSDSSDKTLQQKDIWGAIGVGGVASPHRLEQARFRKALLNKAKALAGAKLSTPTSPISPRKVQRIEQNEVEEEGAIGLEDVADAFISAWADGDTILEEDPVNDHNSDASAAIMDEEMPFAAHLYEESSDHPVGVSPSVLTNSVRIGAVVSQDGVSRFGSNAEQLPLETKDDKIGCETSSATPVAPATAVSRQIDLPSQAGERDSDLPADNLVTVPGISTRFPTKLPAPPRPTAHTKVPVIAKPNPTKSGRPGSPTHTSSDLVTLTSVPWKGPASCRRIVPDYVNFSAVLRAVHHPDIAELEEQLQRIPTSVTLRDGPAIANGIWLPVDIAETEAERVKIPNALQELSLRAGLRCQLQGSSARITTSLAYESGATSQKLSRGSNRVPEQPFKAPRSRPQSPSQTRASFPQAVVHHVGSATTPSKRLNSSTIIKSDEPATKRRKSSISNTTLDRARPVTRAQKHNSRKSPA